MTISNFARGRTAAVVAGATVLVTLGGVGGAVAAGTIGSADIRDGGVHGVDIHDHAVSSNKLTRGVLGLFQHRLESQARDHEIKALVPTRARPSSSRAPTRQTCGWPMAAQPCSSRG